MSYGNAYNIRTKASYSGTTTDANGNLVAQTDTSGGIYGSVTFNGGQGSGDALSINGNAYTLIYSMKSLLILWLLKIHSNQHLLLWRKILPSLIQLILLVLRPL